jgi:hypothetical protein
MTLSRIQIVLDTQASDIPHLNWDLFTAPIFGDRHFFFNPLIFHGLFNGGAKGSPIPTYHHYTVFVFVHLEPLKEIKGEPKLPSLAQISVWVYALSIHHPPTSHATNALQSKATPKWCHRRVQ